MNVSEIIGAIHSTESCRYLGGSGRLGIYGVASDGLGMQVTDRASVAPTMLIGVKHRNAIQRKSDSCSCGLRYTFKQWFVVYNNEYRLYMSRAVPEDVLYNISSDTCSHHKTYSKEHRTRCCRHFKFSCVLNAIYNIVPDIYIS